MRKSLIILSVLLVIGCSDDNETGNNPRTGLLLDNLIKSSGIDRAYHLFVSQNHINRPLVIILHGNGSSHDDIIGENNISSPHKVWLSIAAQNDFMVLIPNGTLGSNNKRGWNDCRMDAMGNTNANDVSFIADLLTALQREFEYDAKKVFVVGTSNGGHMAIRLAQELPDRITAFASILAAMAVNSECTNSTYPLSALFMNGTDDPFLPYMGGEMTANRGEVMSLEQSINYWVTRNKTSIMPSIESIPDNNITDNSTAIKYIYQNGTNNSEVVLYEIVEGGHTEPSIEERYSNIFLRLVGNQNGDFEMAEEIWDFFKNKTK